MKNSHNLGERLSICGAAQHRMSEPRSREDFLGDGGKTFSGMEGGHSWGWKEDFLRAGRRIFLGLEGVGAAAPQECMGKRQ